jgi:hypothetical protein
MLYPKDYSMNNFLVSLSTPTKKSEVFLSLKDKRSSNVGSGKFEFVFISSSSW